MIYNNLKLFCSPFEFGLDLEKNTHPFDLLLLSSVINYFYNYNHN